MQLPIRGKTYPLHFVENGLKLDDIPFLKFQIPNLRADSVIQTSHITKDQLLSVPGFRDTLWTYQRTTYEWIPIFWWSPNNVRPITDFVDIYDVRKVDERMGFWVTPKGFPRDFDYLYGELNQAELHAVKLQA